MHTFAGYAVTGGVLNDALRDARFFAVCGYAVIAEETTKRWFLVHRQAQKQKMGNVDATKLERWYNSHVGRMWSVFVLPFTGTIIYKKLG